MHHILILKNSFKVTLFIYETVAGILVAGACFAMVNELQLQSLGSLKSAIIRLSVGIDTLENIDIFSKLCASTCTSSNLPDLPDLAQLALDGVASCPGHAAPFSVISVLMNALKVWDTSESVIQTAALFLQALLRLLDEEQRPLPSHAIFPALQVCISVLGPRLKVPAIDAIISASFPALNNEAHHYRAGALDTLTSLLTAVPRDDHSLLTKRRIAPLEDLIDLVLIRSQRMARYDESEEVKEAAFRLLVAISTRAAVPSEPTLPQRATKHLPKIPDTKEKEAGSTEIHSQPSSFQQEKFKPTSQVTESANQNENENESHPNLPSPALSKPLSCLSTSKSSSRSPLVALALTPFPDFSKPEGEEACPSVGSLSLRSASPDIFSTLGSDLDSVNETLEMQVGNFLRGSITHASVAMGAAQRTTNNRPEVLKHQANEAFSPKHGSSMAAKRSSVQDRDEIISLIKLLEGLGPHATLLRAAVKGHMANANDYHFTADEFEGILLRCLDMHSEQAYEEEVERAEAALVRTSHDLEGRPDAGNELQRRAKGLEDKVHTIVADKQEQFMETVIPLLAELLMSPKLLQRWLND